MIEDALFSRLTTFSGLSALVGQRVFPNVLQQNVALGAIVYRRVSGARVHSLEGASGLALPVFQFDSLGQSYAEAKAINEQIRLCLDGYRGTVGGVVIKGILFIGDTDIFEDETGFHRVSADYQVMHQEDKPVFS